MPSDPSNRLFMTSPLRGAKIFRIFLRGLKFYPSLHTSKFFLTSSNFWLARFLCKASLKPPPDFCWSKDACKADFRDETTIIHHPNRVPRTLQRSHVKSDEQVSENTECYSSVKKKWNISLVVRRSKSICNENAVDFISLMNYARCTSVTSRQNMYNKLPHSLVIKSSLMNYARRTIVSRRKM